MVPHPTMNYNTVSYSWKQTQGQHPHRTWKFRILATSWFTWVDPFTYFKWFITAFIPFRWTYLYVYICNFVTGDYFVSTPMTITTGMNTIPSELGKLQNWKYVVFGTSVIHLYSMKQNHLLIYICLWILVDCTFLTYLSWLYLWIYHINFYWTHEQETMNWVAACHPNLEIWSNLKSFGFVSTK